MKQVVVLLLLSASLVAQGGFGPQQAITTAAEDASSVYAADLNGDGFLDVISASAHDDKIAWYQNDGTGAFGPQQIISTLADSAESVFATDLDGDNDLDVLSASSLDDKIAWYENLGGGVSTPQTWTATGTRTSSPPHSSTTRWPGTTAIVTTRLSR